MKIEMPKLGLNGKFRMVLSKDAEMKEVITDTGYFDNLITDAGLHRIGTAVSANKGATSFANVVGRFAVGSGTSTPTVSDTKLEAGIREAPGAGTLTETSDYSRGYAEYILTYQFGQGVAAGNLSEIGMQVNDLTGNLWSRSRILDSQGNPTTITVTAQDFLTCYYVLRLNIPQTDAVFETNVYYDDVPTPTTITVRPLAANSVLRANGWGFGPIDTTNTVIFRTGALSPATATNPLGNEVADTAKTTSLITYDPVNNPLKRWVKTIFSLTAQNSSTLRTLRDNRLMGSWQIEFNPPLQKNNTQEMEITVGYSWGRAA